MTHSKIDTRLSQLYIDTPWQPRWQPEFVGTLLFILQDQQVLLIHKKTGHGAGRINGPGGKLEPGEGVTAGACREVFEEVGLRVHDARVGTEMHFVERCGPQWLGFALKAEQFSGNLIETREAKPFWCPIDEIPYHRMWPDDEIWLPRLLRENTDGVEVGHYLFDNEELIEHQIEHVTPSIWQAFGDVNSV